MSEEHREQGRDASASTGDSRTDHFAVPSYAGAPAPDAAHGPEQPAAAGPPTGSFGPPPQGPPLQGPPQGPSDGYFPPPPGHFGGPPTATMPPQPRRQRTMTGIVTAALIAGLVGGGAGFGGAYALLGGDGSGSTLTSSPQAPDSVNAAPGSVTAAAQTVLPSTVDIRATTAQGAAEGSGMILTPEGDILTNNHVVAGGGEITVTLADGTEHPATVVGTSPSYDIAVIRVQGATGLTPATLGESSSLQVGQPVVAIGSPRGLTGTVTTGIVSALDRTVAVPGEDGGAVVYNGLQTDAPINQGNSGGPLVNLDGQVVAVNSAIATAGEQNSGSIGLGFAIPIDQARRVAQEVMDTGTATKPVLGVQGTVGAGTGDGAPIAAVQPGSPAEAAGLAAGDVVTRVDGAQVADFADLMARVGSHAPGEQVTLTVTNGGAERTVDVTLGSQPDEAATTSPGQGGGQSSPFGGGQENPFGGESPFGGGN
ncbi:S1C family serine protease [Pseudonocardia sp. MH-G8]|uniref:S1C family serine protease n=1 Tax=Pseudonocardia sp. MH-G8 TaxID=1854588 RepID=UPI000BA04866|nr:trypsin-like peptidase domain-containing protein [Pseudonocardia sp. MH-G8]OZM83371.1 peptidase S1 [Pseudonocardia sp. MH-G8]